MERLLELTDVEVRMGFAASCVEAAAKRAGCTYKEMYRRMKRVGLIQALASRLDPLHTQSREYVTTQILETLERLEIKQKGDKGC